MRRLRDIEVTTSRRKSNRASDCWLLASARGALRFSRLRSQDESCPWREQRTARLVEIGQGKHSLCPREVLGQAAVSHFGEAPQLLDHPKGMLAAGAGARACAIDHAPAFAQRLAIGAPID